MRAAPPSIPPELAALVRERVAALRDARFHAVVVTFLAERLRERAAANCAALRAISARR